MRVGECESRTAPYKTQFNVVVADSEHYTEYATTGYWVDGGGPSPQPHIYICTRHTDVLHQQVSSVGYCYHTSILWVFNSRRDNYKALNNCHARPWHRNEKRETSFQLCIDYQWFETPAEVGLALSGTYLALGSNFNPHQRLLITQIKYIRL